MNKPKETERSCKSTYTAPFNVLDIYTLSMSLAYRRRSGQKAMYKLGINHFELEMLLCFVGILRMLGRKNVGRDAVVKQISGNHKYKRKLEGYWYGLHSKQFIGEIIAKNGTSSFYIAPLGVKAIKLFEEEYKRMMDKAINGEHIEKNSLSRVYDYDVKSTDISDFNLTFYSHFAPPPPVKNRYTKAA